MNSGEPRESLRRAGEPLCIIEQWSSIVVVVVAAGAKELFIYLLILLGLQAIVANLFYLTNP
jgi:hypothetical protein